MEKREGAYFQCGLELETVLTSGVLEQNVMCSVFEQQIKSVISYDAFNEFEEKENGQCCFDSSEAKTELYASGAD